MVLRGVSILFIKRRAKRAADQPRSLLRPKPLLPRQSTGGLAFHLAQVALGFRAVVKASRNTETEPRSTSPNGRRIVPSGVSSTPHSNTYAPPWMGALSFDGRRDEGCSEIGSTLRTE